MKIGYIVKNDLELNPHLTQRFEFKEATFTRAIKKKNKFKLEPMPVFQI